MQSPQVKPSDAEDEEGIQRGILGRKGETGEADYQGGEKIEKVSSDQELCMTQERQTVGDESKPEVEVQHSLDRSESSMDKLYEDSSDVWASELRDESPVKKVQAGARVKNEFQQWIKMLRRPGTCRHMCHQDEGSIANAVLWQLLFLLAAALSGITALTLSQNDASKDWKTDGVRIHNIFAYSACIWYVKHYRVLLSFLKNDERIFSGYASFILQCDVRRNEMDGFALLLDTSTVVPSVWKILKDFYLLYH